MGGGCAMGINQTLNVRLGSFPLPHPTHTLLLLPWFHFSGNSIGDEGACALAESLKQNTTLTSLNLEGMSELNCEKQWVAAAQWESIKLLMCVLAHSPSPTPTHTLLLLPWFHFSDNSIGSEGARALAEFLKQNTILTSLNLESMSELNCGKQWVAAAQ